MVQHPSPPVTYLRRRRVEQETGLSRSSIYRYVAIGLWPRPVRVGVRSVAWPAADVAEMNAARLAGHTDEQIQRLVARIHAARRTAARNA